MITFNSYQTMIRNFFFWGGGVIQEKPAISVPLQERLDSSLSSVLNFVRFLISMSFFMSFPFKLHSFYAFLN